MRFLLILLFFVAALIPLFECYRFVRQSPYRYRYRVERSIPNEEEENYRVVRNVGNSGYRVAPAYRYRIHRSVNDNDNNDNKESPEITIENEPNSNENNPYRFRANESPENPKSPASNETPADCTNGDQKGQLFCIKAFFDKKSIHLSSDNLLPAFSDIYPNFYNDNYERNKQEFEDFIQCLTKRDISEKCFYLSNLKKISKYPNDAKSYTEFFNTINFLYKNSITENGLHCEIEDYVICEIEKATNNCDVFQKFVDCYMFLYDHEPCPIDFREDFCHLISTDLLKDEYIPSDCFIKIDSGCSDATKINFNLSILINVYLMKLSLLFLF